jgi:hypothetical protein
VRVWELSVEGITAAGWCYRHESLRCRNLEGMKKNRKDPSQNRPYSHRDLNPEPLYIRQKFFTALHWNRCCANALCAVMSLVVGAFISKR